MDYKNILIVDDSATSRLIIRRCFEMAGFSQSVYHEAANGAEAMEFLEDSMVDLILSDIKMPKMDGLTFIRKIRLKSNTKETPIMVISSVGDNTANEQLIKDQIKAVIQKPISPAKVATALGGV